MKKLLNFIKYNNAFTIIISLILFSTAGAFANEKVRDTVIGQTIVTKNGTDNTQIISANLDSFDMGLKINSVKEDTQFYYVNFNYNAIDVKDGVWQSVAKEKNMNVLKTRLGDTDLGLYLAEELKQLTDREMSYMKEVQSIEKNKGLKKQTESVEYTGLKGLVFDNETKELVGYEPVKENDSQKAEVLGVFNPSPKSEEEKKTEKEEDEKVIQQITVVKETVSKETIMEMVREALAQEQGSANSSLSAGLPAAEAGEAESASSESSSSVSSSSSEAISSSSSESSSVVSGGGSGSQVSSSDNLPTGQAGSSVSSAASSENSSEAASSSEAIFSSSSSEQNSSSESSSSSEAVSSSSEASSSSSSSEAVSSLPASEASSSSGEAGLPASEASSSSVAI